MPFYDDDDRYAVYEEMFDPKKTDRKARRKRKPKPVHTPKKTKREIIEELADLDGLEAGFETTYQPSKHEAGWLLKSLRTFYDQQLITDVEAIVKGGKEASVYRCAGHETTGQRFLAAKVYRPRMFRSLSNDAQYRQGRGLLTSDGHDVDGTDARLDRAVRKKSAFGEQVRHTSWLMHEFTALKTLHEAGAAVPEPIAAGENAILMAYYGDDAMPAPTLSEVSISQEEALPLFKVVVHNIALMLRHGYVHGDLSAFNMLYWQGEIVLIDFPQIVEARKNPDARDLLTRDVQRVCDYFEGYGLQLRVDEFVTGLWAQTIGDTTDNRLADFSRLMAEAEQEEA